MSKKVDAIGNKNANIAVVAEAPGKVEVAQGKPFVGPSGRLLNKLLKGAGIKRRECYITNVYKYKLPRNDFDILYNDTQGKKPTDKLIKARNEVRKEIKEVNPNVIICLGAEALKTFMHDNEIKISQWRGSILNTKYGKVVPTFHPAYLNRQYHYRNICVLDLIKAEQESHSTELELPNRDLYTKPTFKDVQDFIEYCKNQEYLSFDIEVVGGKTPNAYIDCIGLAPYKDKAMSIPFCNPDGSLYWNTIEQETKVWRMVANVLSDFNIKKIAQNAQFDIVYLERNKVPVNNLYADTMNIQRLIAPEFPASLAFLTSIYTREPYYKDTMEEDRWIYNAKDAAVTLEVYEKLLKDAEEIGLKDFYFDHVHPLIEAYIEIGEFGIRIDKEKMENQKELVEEQVKDLKDELTELIGREINVKSPIDVPKFLFEERGYEPTKFSEKTGKPSTDKEVMNELIRKNDDRALELIRDIREKRDEVAKELNTKISPDGRMRCTFNVAGTKTGRLSSSATIDGTGRNLQNVPKYARDMFIADPGYVFVSADLSQAESRVVAYLSGDKNMINIIENGKYKFHIENAAKIFDKDPSEIDEDSEEYDLGKRISHSASYRMGPVTAAKYMEVETKVAKQFMNRFHNTYPLIKKWQNDTINTVKKTRMLINPFGRKRKFYGRMDDRTFNQACNFVPQSTVADIMHTATRNLYARLPHPDMIIIQIHDEMVLQVLEKDADKVSKMLKDELEIPFVVNGTEISIPAEPVVGKNWGEIS